MAAKTSRSEIWDRYDQKMISLGLKRPTAPDASDQAQLAMNAEKHRAEMESLRYKQESQRFKDMEDSETAREKRMRDMQTHALNLRNSQRKADMDYESAADKNHRDNMSHRAKQAADASNNMMAMLNAQSKMDMDDHKMALGNRAQRAKERMERMRNTQAQPSKALGTNGRNN